MLFSSIVFIFYFLPVLLLFYYAAGLRTAVLLAGSVVFYTWGEGAYVFLLAALIGINFALGRAIHASEGSRRAWLTALAIVIDLGVLGWFKYGGFIAQNLNHLLHLQLPVVHLRLPLGISFFTFQLISYLIDIKRDAIRPEPNLMRFATYILMFPHLIAGPIVRYADIRDELRERHFSIDRTGLGVQYFIVGLCQKVLIANTLAPIADHFFGLAPEQLGAATGWLGVLAYTLQIYFDFCGYSNMAIGLAFLLGFTFPKNFDYPYAAQSITEFWRRWHMSLSFWFRDYVYISLGGNRDGRWRTYRNLVIVFFLTGLWHGAAWNFIVWGLYHGAFLLLERMGLSRVLDRIGALPRHAYVLLVVMLGWVFFRAVDLSHAMQIIAQLFGRGARAAMPDSMPLPLLLTPEAIAALVLGCLFSFPLLPKLLDALRQPRIARSAQIGEARLDTVYVHALPIVVLLVGFVLCIALLVGNSLNPFLYFRF
ncbi:MAG: MBOAT family O-acyltransferase [Lysobacteraceae bacterium]